MQIYLFHLACSSRGTSWPSHRDECSLEIVICTKQLTTIVVPSMRSYNTPTVPYRQEPLPYQYLSKTPVNMFSLLPSVSTYRTPSSTCAITNSFAQLGNLVQISRSTVGGEGVPEYSVFIEMHLSQKIF